MTIFCTPQYILLAILLCVVLFIGGTMMWQGRADRLQANDFDGGKWLLVGLTIVAVISFGIFLAYTFSHVGAMGVLGC
jgi:predicted small integral membrane protein